MFVKFIEKLFARNIFHKSVPAAHVNLGKEGESIAKKFLSKKGLKFICANFRSGSYEIDIIFQDKKRRIIIFVEVKTRSDDTLGYPEEAINRKKQSNVKRAARVFLTQNPQFNTFDIRFDTISVIKKNETILINHIENAF